MTFLVCVTERVVISEKLDQYCLLQDILFKNSSLNACSKRENHFIELFNLKSLLDILADQRCHSHPTLFSISLCCGVFVSPPGKLVMLTSLQECVLTPSEVSRHLLI